MIDPVILSKSAVAQTHNAGFVLADAHEQLTLESPVVKDVIKEVNEIQGTFAYSPQSWNVSCNENEKERIYENAAEELKEKYSRRDIKRALDFIVNVENSPNIQEARQPGFISAAMMLKGYI